MKCLKLAIELITGYALRTLAATLKNREEVDKIDNWACLSCADLSKEQKQKRSNESAAARRNKNELPAFQKHFLEFVAPKDEPVLTVQYYISALT